MTIDIPVDSPKGNVLSASWTDCFVKTDENEISSNLRTSENNPIPVVVLKKLDNDEKYYVVSQRLRTGTCPSYEMDLSPANLKRIDKGSVSPRKRGRPRKSENDLQLTPKRIQKTRNELNYAKDDVENLCTSLKDNVKLVTPAKRSLNKTDFSDDSVEGSPPSRKIQTPEVTPIKITPRGRGRPKINRDSPMKPNQKDLVLSEKRQIKTPMKFRDSLVSPAKSAKINLDESFRRSVLKSTLNRENVKNESNVQIRRSRRESLSVVKNSTPRKSKRAASYAPCYYYDIDDEEIRPKTQCDKVESVKRRIRGSRSNSTSSGVSDIGAGNKSDGDDEYIPTINEGIRTITNLEVRIDKESVSPRKRGRSKKTEKDPQLSPKKIQKTRKESNYAKDDNVDKLCTSLKDNIKLVTPVKKSLNKTAFSDDSMEESPPPRKMQTPEGTSTKATPRGRGRPKINRDSPMKTVRPKTPNRRKQILRPRKESIASSSSEESELSPEREPQKEAKTPRSHSMRNTPKTPKNRLKLLRDGVITPSMHPRSSLIQGDSTPLMKARSQLHVSYVPTSLPCREKEYLDVYNFLRGKLDDGCGGCMYISGVPGTGKTATVTSVIHHLQNEKKVPAFSYVSVNGMRITEPRQSYVEIWKQLTGKTVPWEQAQSLLEERFTKKKKMSPVVMLIDELDILCTKRQDVVYNLLDWPTKSKDQLIVMTIANTMDLPERLLMSRVTSRLGLTRLTFQAYTHKQLMEIVTKRLTGTESFNSDAIQLVARKVASVSGDARRALDICRRAAEIAEDEGKGQLVNIMHINEALNAMITQPQVMAIRRCSRLQKLLLQAIVAEIERTGVEETTFSDVFRILVSCCALDGFKTVSTTAALRAICELSAYRLIIADQKCSNLFQRIILNVSVHDVYFALKKE